MSKAAINFAHLAQNIEESGKQSARVVGNLWQQAASAYEQTLLPPEERERKRHYCQQAARRLLGWPDLYVSITLQETLQLNEWHQLCVQVENKGASAARMLSLKVSGVDLVINEHRTQQLPSLGGGQSNALDLVVKPMAAGEAVPLTIKLNYLCDNGTPEEKCIRCTIAVHADAPSPLPPYLWRDEAWRTPSTIYHLAQEIDRYFSISEINRMCRYVFNLDPENLPGTLRIDRAIALVEHAAQHNQLTKLLDELQIERPKVETFLN
ncbi:MAG: hypothetical protein ACPG8W_25510 [Candidatus Promineifilaceae bacterium]